MAAIIVLDVFVGIIAVLGLIALANQLRAQHKKKYAKGVVMIIDRLTPRRRNLARLEVRLRMAGPAVRYEVGLDLEADGNRFDVSTPKPEIHPSMGCDDEEISWGFEVPDEDLDTIKALCAKYDVEVLE